MTRRAILWDMDGTLIDSEPVHGLAFDAAIRALGLIIPDGFHDDQIGADGEHVFQALVDQTGISMGLDAWLALKWHHFCDHADRIERREPVSRVAEKLAAQNTPMAVVSNSTPEEVVLGLKMTGLAHISDVIISRADVEEGKPDPEGYLLAASRLRRQPDNCLVVEDSLLGSKAGVAAGMSVLFHPQSPLTDMRLLPKGASYLAPDADPMEAIIRFLTTGNLEEA
ncbi:HAD family phosphatase [uncultured Aliiroseovarius sp.]|uniref:HAD family hydrolase n=1 Tax=uncultured Aliiroseovarius sp. TaxID=1658783 RepID=UPI002591B418|nr:HAD family phosphatase [uncultured Aliiroseovarius sp.]